ncbi:hypothetical protein C530_032 [Candidatus Portiera aleyrodidarum BT-B-HRs]|nr:hypothetical protein C530_032 [Candidatus Portiera aleyrodidarum BT-B-HRs]
MLDVTYFCVRGCLMLIGDWFFRNVRGYLLFCRCLFKDVKEVRV